MRTKCFFVFVFWLGCHGSGMICVRNSPFLLCPLWDFFLGQSHSFAGFREESPSRKTDNPHNDERWWQTTQRSQQQHEKYWLGKKVECEVVYFGIASQRSFWLENWARVYLGEEVKKQNQQAVVMFVRLHGFKVTASSVLMCSRSDLASGQTTVCCWRTCRQTCDWLDSELEGGEAGSGVVCLCIWEITPKIKLEIWEKLVDRKYFKTSEGLKLKDVGNIWRNVKNYKSWWEKKTAKLLSNSGYMLPEITSGNFAWPGLFITMIMSAVGNVDPEALGLNLIGYRKCDSGNLILSTFDELV